jgi:hypothetical protein
MKPPNKNKSGDHVAAAAACMNEPNKPDCYSPPVKAELEDLAWAYVAAADAEHAAKLARIEARDRLIQAAPVGSEFEGVRVQKRNCWKLNDEAVAEMTATRAALIEAGKAELVPSVVAIRIGREEE